MSAQDDANEATVGAGESRLFCDAVIISRKEILRALKSPTTVGHPLEHELIEWRRSAFSSGVDSKADLRLVFRARSAVEAIDVIAFGIRRFPDTRSIYHVVARRAGSEFSFDR